MERYTFIKSIVSRKKMKLAIWDEETGDQVKWIVVELDDPEIMKKLIEEFKNETDKLNKL